ncbi:MAG TPA: hypothetical protein DCM38_02185 [Gammaproteobacteria bacterium]|nr:hypothetical protein [Gammaproteobacteria bacterium]
MKISFSELDLEQLTQISQGFTDGKSVDELFPYKPLVAFEQFTPGPMPYQGITLFLLKRKPDVTSVPYLLMYLFP